MLAPDTPNVCPADVAIAHWIVDQGLTGPSLADLLDGLCERLVGAGLPIRRAFLAMPVINPDLRAISLRWRAGGGGIARETVPHVGVPDAFLSSPFWTMQQRGETFGRWRLGPGAPPTAHPVLDMLGDAGMTDYIAHLVSFDASRTRALEGCAISFATREPGGFSDEEVARLSAMVSLLGLAAYRFVTSDLLVEVLGCYVGRDAGHRVLRGEIRRGIGQSLSAALMFADLRGFTGVAEGSGEGLVGRLGDHLAAMVEPVEARGGEVLKFLGDGLLAAFPIEDATAPHAACAAALAAGMDALVRNRAVNLTYAGEPPLALDVALHRGEVFYGNIGAGRRLDFTVIGPAVNEASRIEAMCGVLDRALLMSEPFALCCGQGVVSLGRHKLRGVAEARELFGAA